MICNIVDHRTNRYDVNIDAVFEPCQHDNSIPGATQFAWGQAEFSYDELRDTTIVRAIEFANNRWECPVTLFIYDRNSAFDSSDDSL
jgi:hypothetical protein